MNPGIMIAGTSQYVESQNPGNAADSCGMRAGQVSCPTAVIEAAAPDTPVEIMSTRAWRLGYACHAPRRAIRDNQTSRPRDAVWILTCGNAAYRVILIPGAAAHVERIEKPAAETAR
jgi:hypothetical protein